MDEKHTENGNNNDIDKGPLDNLYTEFGDHDEPNHVVYSGLDNEEEHEEITEDDIYRRMLDFIDDPEDIKVMDEENVKEGDNFYDFTFSKIVDDNMIINQGEVTEVLEDGIILSYNDLRIKVSFKGKHYGFVMKGGEIYAPSNLIENLKKYKKRLF